MMKGTAGKPKYKYTDNVSFMLDGKVIDGVVYVVDAYGTFFDDSEPSYDIYCEGNNTLYKHIAESAIIV